MGMEIPGVVPGGLHSDLRTADLVSHRKIAGDQGGEKGSFRDLQLDLKAAVDKLEKMVTQFNRRFDITLNQQINRIVVKVIDTETDEVIKEIPPEEIQHLLVRMNEMMGLFINEKI